jgi:glucose-6-phosphate isomerase
MTQADTAAAFQALHVYKDETARRSISDLFAQDRRRAARLRVELDDLLFDYSKQRVDDRTLELLFALAQAARIEEKRAALFSGAKVNRTEGRAALHMALRDRSGRAYLVDGRDVSGDVAAERAKFYAFAEAVRDGGLRGAQGAPFTDVVNIGIGGSDLGPAMATRALAPFAKPDLRAHFVSNVDGADLGDTIAGLDPARTLFIISSKTFSTLETMTNARSARAWIATRLGEGAVANHFAAVSTNLELVDQFGVRADRVFGFWDWVGGRYSVWSAIGLALVIAVGPSRFDEFLDGGHEIDRHFETAPLAANIPALMGLIGVWNRNVWGCASHAVIPYDNRLARFPAYLQQLEMESNGKTATLSGDRTRLATCPVVWGEPGTNGQHAFFQLMHQGTDIIPVDFLVAAEPTDADPRHHELLFANCLAQSEALMRGRSRAEVEAQLAHQGKSAAEASALAPHKTFEGDRPSNTFVYRRLDPRALGRLIALYEHAVFVEGAIWDIDSFDQWGVELGKELAGKLAPFVSDPARALGDLDPSTAGLISWRRRLAAG